MKSQDALDKFMETFVLASAAGSEQEKPQPPATCFGQSLMAFPDAQVLRSWQPHSFGFLVGETATHTVTQRLDFRLSNVRGSAHGTTFHKPRTPPHQSQRVWF